MSSDSESDHAPLSSEDDDDALPLPVYRPKETKKKKKANKLAKKSPAGSDEDDDNKELAAPPQKEACGLDMRWTFPIDEYDAQTAQILGILSHFMKKMQRTLSESELMGYVYVWLALCNTVNRINHAAYGSRMMSYRMRHLSGNCFRFDIIARLHELCYGTFQYCMDHLYDLVDKHGIVPVVLSPPVKHVVPIEHKELCRMLRAQVEFCQLAIVLVHRPWRDFADAWGDEKPDQADVDYMSQAHTATLGVVCSHLYQVMATLVVKPTDPRYSVDVFYQYCWQSAGAFDMAQRLLPLPEKNVHRANLRRLSAQLQVAVFRVRATAAVKSSLWGAAAYYTFQILRILGASALAEPDRNALHYQTQQAHEHKATVYEVRPEFDRRELLADLDKHMVRIGLTAGGVQTMSHDVIAELIKELWLQYGYAVPNFPRLRLRNRNGDIVSPDPQRIADLLRK